MLRRDAWRVAGLVAVSALALGQASCCRKPPASVVEVNLALSRAKEACAALYAPQELEAVESRVDEMNRLADVGKCAAAGSAAEPMQPDVLAFSNLVLERKERARAEAERSLAEAESALASARGAAAGRPAPEDLDAAERSLAMARRMSADPCSFLRAAALAREAAERARAAAAGGV